MNIACPECSTLYRVDPDRVPDGGAMTRCRECETTFWIDDTPDTMPPGEFVTADRAAPGETPSAQTAEADGPADGVADDVAETAEPMASRTAETAAVAAASDTVEAAEAAPAEVEDESESPETPVFGPQDPKTRARRLARALVSDIKVYHPDKWEESTRAGTLRADFRDEIMKSWDEYVEQVGEDMAKKTPYFRDALNEILAQGESVF